MDRLGKPNQPTEVLGADSLSFNAFTDAQEVERTSLAQLEPFLKRISVDGRWVKTDKGRLSRELQASYGDAFSNVKPHGDITAIEVKAEEFERYGRFAFETWSNWKTKRPGWLMTLKCDLLLYHFLDDWSDDHHGLLYCIPFQAMKHWCFDTQGRLRMGRIYDFEEKTQWKRRQHNETKFRAVDIWEFTCEVKCTAYRRINGEWIRNFDHDKRNGERGIT
jgi:hypothetical protein